MKWKFSKKDITVILMILAMNLIQGQLYYAAKLFPIPAMNLNNPLDDAIPFIPEFVYPYVLWHLLLFIVPYYLYKKHEDSFYLYFTANIISDVFCFLIFVFFPTIMMRPTIEVTGLTTWILNLVYLGDMPPANCFPSLHCTTSFLFLYLFLGEKRLPTTGRIFGIVIFPLIILSTIFVKQHVLVDVIGAFLQSFLIYLVVTQFHLAEKFKMWLEKKKVFQMEKSEF